MIRRPRIVLLEEARVRLVACAVAFESAGALRLEFFIDVIDEVLEERD